MKANEKSRQKKHAIKRLSAPDKSQRNGFASVVQSGDEYYKQIVDFANVAIVKFDRNLILTDFTGNSESIFGFSKEEVIGKSLEETIVPKVESTGKDLGKFIKSLARKPEAFEYNINENITKDGRRIWMQWHNSAIKDSGNRVTGILSIGIDITDLINTELALKESEERFKTLSDLTFEGILIHDNGIILDCNLSFERQIGYSREELIGTNMLEKLIPQEYHHTVQNNFRKETSQYEIEAVHRNGTRIPVSIEARRAKIGEKSVRVAAIRNISDLKRTIKELDNYKNHLEELVAKRTAEIKLQSEKLAKQNELLQFERNQLRIIIDNIPDLIYIKDKKSRFLNANRKQIKHLGAKDLQDVIGKTDFDFYTEQYASAYYSDEQRIFKTGVPIFDREEPTVNEEGKILYLLTTKVPLHDTTGKITGIVGIGRDITEKKLAENKLKESNKKLEDANIILKEKSREIELALDKLKNAQSQLIQSEKMASLGVLTAGIAHEINNPVNFVYAGVNSLMKDFNDIKPVLEAINRFSATPDINHPAFRNIEGLKKQYDFETAYKAITETLDDIKLGAARISEIVAGLSRFSRIETEKWKRSDLHEEIDSVLVLLKNKYKHHIEILKKYHDPLPEVECHPGKMNQVFLNVINNAIDAIEGKPGVITIETGVAKDRVIISVKDTGKGISEDEKLKIFDPFFTTKEVGYGLGLGLAITYSIIREHNGEITVDSTVGKGTTFKIEIPVARS
ncbi:MAG: PAS domain S-box protein [Bacteroidales bacterium]|nr:PAS domain S-box protein [Bacteroidales bacterium]